MAIKYLGAKASPWRVYWRNPYTRKIETKHFASQEEAERHDSLVKHWLKFEPENLRPEEEAKPAASLTVEDIVWTYLRDRKLKPKSLRDTVYHLKAVLAVIGAIQADEISKTHMRSLVRTLRDKGLKANGINRKIGIIKTAFNWAEETELIKVSPISNFKCPRGSDTQIPPPSETEVERILAVASSHIIRTIVLGWHFGMRIGESELFALEWSHVDLVRGTILIWSADKNQDMQWRELKISANLLPVIVKWRKDDEVEKKAAEEKRCGPKNRESNGRTGEYSHVIHWKGKRIGSIKRAWKEALRRAGITRRIRPYDLRHAHATQALAHGADIKAVSQNMGHADTSMIHRHYQHVLVKQRDAALAAVPLVRVPSSTALEAIAELETRKGKKFVSVDDLKADLNADD